MGKETGENVPQEALGRKTGEDGKKISASRFPVWKNDCVRNSLALPVGCLPGGPGRVAPYRSRTLDRRTGARDL